MSPSTRKGLLAAVLIHVGVILLAVLLAALQQWWKKPQPLIFQLVTTATAPAPSPQPDSLQPAVTPPEPVRLPEFEPLQNVPDLPPLPVQPPSPQPQPPPRKEPELIDIRDFRRDRKPPPAVQPVTPRPSRPTPVPEIDTKVRDRLQRQIAPIRLQGIDVAELRDNDQLQAYLAALRQQIQEVFQPSGSRLEAEAQFTVTARGQIHNPRLSRPSGSSAFDESVLRALRAARTPGPPPGNRDYEFSLTFRSE